MIFATYWFFAFAALFLPVFWLLRNKSARLVWLLGACVIFHAHYAGPAGVLPIIVIGIITYFAGLSRHRTVCLLAIAVCVGALCFYKYSIFFFSNVFGQISPAVGRIASEWAKNVLPQAPPLGISFFAFEFVHYLYDVREGTPPLRNFFQFTAFSIFFPSLVAGPIKRYEQFIPSLKDGLAKVNAQDSVVGIVQVAFGYLKKVVADNLTLYLDAYQDQFADLHLDQRWVLFTAIAFRILFDFSGYSDIAIGLARMMGIRLPPNFNWPYFATSIQTFWQRWHMSLSSWIRDYVYIPLGGSRHGQARRILNGVVAFGLCGLWHGAAWNFVIWGLYHGIGLGVCASYRHLPFGVGKTLERVLSKLKPINWFLTQAFVWLGWLLFFYPVDKALKMARLLFAI
jgi:alginate O-acetyltransferase complex protein AlgI